MGLWLSDGSPDLGQKSRPNNNQQQKEKKKKTKKRKKKRICKIVNFAGLAYHRMKLKESEKKDRYLDLARELKKIMEHEDNNYTNCDWCFWYSN